MNSVLTIILILITVIFLGLIIMFFLKRKFKLGLIMTIITLLAIISGIGFIVNEKHSNVFVYGATEDEALSIPIKHKRIVASGKSYSFQVKKDLEEMYSIVKVDNPDALIDGNMITIIKGNQMYDLKLIEEAGNKRLFELNAQYIIHHYTEEKTLYIPFPEDVVIGSNIVDSTFKVTSSFNDLIDYYHDFTNITVIKETIFIQMNERIQLDYNNGEIEISIN